LPGERASFRCGVVSTAIPVVEYTAAEDGRKDFSNYGLPNDSLTSRLTRARR